MRYYVTYFDRNYFARGLALIESLHSKSRSPFTLYVHCMDELTRLILSKLEIPSIMILARFELEAYDTALTSTMHTRDAREYLWTMTPTIILRTLERFPNIDFLTYLDADQYVFSDPEVIFHELNSGSCLIHEHRFSRELEHMAQNGIYNVGVLAFPNDSRGRSILEWWRLRCIEWCYAKPHDGKMGDQGYLNDWPTRFKDVIVTQNIGIGVAPWNMRSYSFNEGPEGQVLINNVPIVVFHFHGIKLLDPRLIVLMDNLTYSIPVNTVRLCYLPYVEALLRAFELLQKHSAEFPHGFNINHQISIEYAILANGPLQQALVNSGFNPEYSLLSTDWALFPGQQIVHNV